MNRDPFADLVADWWEREANYTHPQTPPPGRREGLDATGKVRMLLEDLRMRALPYGSRGAEDGFRVHLTPDNGVTAQLVLDALPVRTSRHRELTRACRDYVETALWRLASSSVYLKLVYYYRPVAPPGTKPVAFRIEVLEPERVHKRFGRYRYWMPMVRPGSETSEWVSVPLSRESVIVVSLPSRLRRTMNRTIRVISATNQDLEVVSSFTTGQFAGTSAFDLASYNRQVADVVLRETREVGWTGRGLLTEGMLDPFKAWRAVQFARFDSILRDIALRGLQTAIDRAGARIGFEAKLQLSGVMTEADLDQLETDLRAGSRPIREILNPEPPR